MVVKSLKLVVISLFSFFAERLSLEAGDFKGYQLVDICNVIANMTPTRVEFALKLSILWALGRVSEVMNGPVDVYIS